MFSSARRLASASLVLLALCAPAQSAPSEPARGVVRGEVTDLSGGVLPGVTVVSASADGSLVTAVTDGTGVYAFPPLPAGPAKLSFQLDGFAPVAVGVTVRPDVESFVVERLGPAPVTETVNVYAKAPVPAPPPPPAPVIIPVPPHDHEAVCGPAKAESVPVSYGTIASSRFDASRELYTKDDQVLIDGGTAAGLAVGQNVLARRHFQVAGPTGGMLTGEHTSGLLQIVEADDRSSVAVVVYACDEITKGDFLALFDPYLSKSPAPGADHAGAAMVLFADAGQMVGFPGRMLVVDRGAETGIEVGQRLTLVRRQANASARPITVGSAVVVAVRGDSATIRVDRATDLIAFGDWAVAEHQTPSRPKVTRGARLLRR